MPKNMRKRKLEESGDGKKKRAVPKKEYVQEKFKPFTAEMQAEEEHLSNILFGGETNFLQSLEEAENETPGMLSPSMDSGVGDSEESDKERAAAWMDEEDFIETDIPNEASTKTKKSLKQKFVEVVGQPSWADVEKRRHDDDSDDDILQTCGFIKKNAKLHLPSNLLDFKVSKPLHRGKSNSYITSVEFHPTSSVAMVAGVNGIVHLYTVDGKKNEMIHTTQFKDYKVFCSRFTSNGSELIVGNNMNYCYAFDLMSMKTNKIAINGVTHFKKFVVSPDGKCMAICGNSGAVHVVNTHTKEKMFSLQQNSKATALAFNPQSNMLFGHGENGEVTVWDMGMRRVKHVWTDEGCLQGTCIDISPSGQFVATGSAQGVVNVYDTESLTKKYPVPVKSIMNLKTEIWNVQFNHSSEMLSLYSSEIQNTVKIFHLGSKTVFSNFPQLNPGLNKVRVAAFSPGSGYLAVGSMNNLVSLYRLNHYKSY
ncbi:PREDICTED: U3 small nucleolar RNA-associated protein 18 homolog [Nicrophorus vespilloides]|uniref:U3 small nucleolar RNA-associated protein 18 homolog n=1 Tax=Nicrophorus vespilloides TaxID=110193 RepID=A0ABM1M037_NICVS|nr:PREDICTED: U3 small nucleolar RNA-associated protein 18 homolog [Nicrophorus vespilloides]